VAQSALHGRTAKPQPALACFGSHEKVQAFAAVVQVAQSAIKNAAAGNAAGQVLN